MGEFEHMFKINEYNTLKYIKNVNSQIYKVLKSQWSYLEDARKTTHCFEN